MFSMRSQVFIVVDIVKLIMESLYLLILRLGSHPEIVRVNHKICYFCIFLLLDLMSLSTHFRSNQDGVRYDNIFMVKYHTTGSRMISCLVTGNGSTSFCVELLFICRELERELQLPIWNHWLGSNHSATELVHKCVIKCQILTINLNKPITKWDGLC